MGPVPVLNKASGEFPVGAGSELYPDGRVAKVDPVADVPRADLSCLCKGFEARCEFTYAKNPAGFGKAISLLSCRLAITVLRPHPGIGAGYLSQLKLENTAVDAVAFHQELCNGVVE
jgi:hypothetical protein